MLPARGTDSSLSHSEYNRRTGTDAGYSQKRSGFCIILSITNIAALVGVAMLAPWATKFGIALGGWLMGGFIILIALGMWDPTLYFIIAFVGFLLATEYSEPPRNRPTWHRRLRWVTLVNLLVFAYIVVRWVEETVGVAIL
jgi:hypothetical protein